jgi:uncharacterized membrane protein
VRTPLFAVGLSLATLMGLGLLTAELCPLFGLDHPFTLVPVVTLGIIITFLVLVAFWRDQYSAADAVISQRDVLTPPVLASCLLPFLSVFAPYAMNAYASNVLLLALITVIA